MLKKDITYTNYNDEEVTRTFYFNVSTAEILRKEAEENLEGGYSTLLERISQSQNGKELMPVFEEFIQLAYGVRSGDGSEFDKSPEHFAKFKASGAFDALFLEFLTNVDFASEFVRNVLPSPEAIARAAEQVSNAASETIRRQPQDHLPSAREQFAQAQAEKQSAAGTTDANTAIVPGTGAQDDEFAQYQEWKRQQAAQNKPAE